MDKRELITPDLKGKKKPKTGRTLDTVSLENDPEIARIPEILDEVQAEIEDINAKTELLSIQELKFIEYHLRIGLPIKKAMKKAGYRGLKPGKLYYTAIKIVEKYERRAQDHRKIMRLLGAGEVFVIQNQKDLAKNAKSEVARQAANATIGKWLGMSGELSHSNEGVTVIIQGPDAAVQINTGQPTKTPAPTQQAPYQHPQPSRPGEPIQIYK